MHDDTDPDPEQNAAERLHAVVDRMLEPHGKSSPRGVGLINQFAAPFDTNKPNQHDSKAEFQREMDAVEGSLNQVSSAVQLLTTRDTETEQVTMLERLRPIIDQKLKSNAPRGRIADSVELVRRNIADVGGFTASIFVLLDLWTVLAERHQELRDQESKFWNLPHRAPDYYARAIALRLAKLYAKETGQRPTVGTSGVSGDPSTDFARALKEVFGILKIKSGVRPQAEWAVSQLTEEDLQPPGKTLGQILGLGLASQPRNRLADIANAVEKKRGD